MTNKRVDETTEKTPMPIPNLIPQNLDLNKVISLAPPADADMAPLSQLRADSEPWKGRGETAEQSLEALTKLRPFARIAKYEGQLVGYFTVERDGPVQGAAYMRNIVVKTEFRRRGLGVHLLKQAIETAKELHRRTLALRVDPANAPAVNFYRNAGFTTVATVVSKKSGKLRLLMSRELDVPFEAN